MIPQHQTAHFNGPEYDPAHDLVRLTGQIKRVYDLMQDGTWRTKSISRIDGGDALRVTSDEFLVRLLDGQAA